MKTMVVAPEGHGMKSALFPDGVGVTKSQNLGRMAGTRELEFEPEMIAELLVSDEARRGQAARGFNQNVVQTIGGGGVIAGGFTFHKGADQIDGFFLFVSSLAEERRHWLL